MTKIKYSILIIIKSGKYLDKLFNSIEKLNYSKEHIEVIILNNNCNSKIGLKLKKIIKNKSYFKLIKVNNDYNIPQARNYLLKFAKGKYIIFTDHDVILEPEWINKFENNFKKGYDIIGGIMDSKQKKILPILENHRKNFWYKFADSHNIYHFEMANCAFKRELINKISFDNKAKFSEDLDFTNQAIKRKLKPKFDLNIYVYHNHREKLIDYIKTFFKYGMSYSYINKKDRIISIKRIIKIYFYVFFPIIFVISFLLIKKLSLLLLLMLMINKYSIPTIKSCILKRKIILLGIFILEPIRFFAWSYGFLWGNIKNEL